MIFRQTTEVKPMARLSGHMTIAAVGKLRFAYWQAAQEEYLKRLQRYTDVKVIEVKDVAGRSTPDDVARQREGEQLLKTAENTARKIALTPTGRQMDSLEFADFLQKQIELYGRLALFIGGPLGLSDEVVASCDDQLSLSPLTFPHELARVMLLEQLYRACTILSGEQYHK
jgi:23S rRNA (pseudouridine1915-N3)-methyltransferase